ncbi:MAG TPA: DUF1343 domain-containing protein [Geobacteraceae bacterium]|nr:DUF1343 domain-containing protein [Geobacteraceae bacterium]
MTRVFTALTCLAVFFGALPAYPASLVKVGARVLHDSGYAELAGKRIGLITNQTAVADDVHTADLMHASGKVQLVDLFAPEHGLRGLKEDGEKVGDRIDERTGAHVYSLYGRVKKPTPEMLRGLDLLVFDIQGVGARFYTYISTMGLAMQAAAEAHIPFLVLDRPNPIDGDYFSGFVLEKGYNSFVGEYPIPVAHGMTAGELALMIKGECMLPGLEGLDLRVVKMEGWRRDMQWPETGLKWLPTSPNIPDFETALLYSGICFFEGTVASVGRGTTEPFKVVGFPGINVDALTKRLNDRHLPGVEFEPTLFTPRSIPGKSSQPKFRDQEVTGLRIMITNPHAYKPVETAVHLLCAMYGSLGKEQQEHFFHEEGFDHLAGTCVPRKLIQKGASPEEIIATWQEDIRRFAERRRKYLLY